MYKNQCRLFSPAGNLHAAHGQIFLHDRVYVRLRSCDITSVRWKMQCIGCSITGSTQSFPRKCDGIKVDRLGTILCMVCASKDARAWIYKRVLLIERLWNFFITKITKARKNTTPHDTAIHDSLATHDRSTESSLFRSERAPKYLLVDATREEKVSVSVKKVNTP